MIELYKDGNTMAIRTDCVDAENFSKEFCGMLSEMIAMNCYEGDWDFQLSYWLPQFSDIYMNLKGGAYKVSHKHLASGEIFPEDLEYIYKDELLRTCETKTKIQEIIKNV